MVLDGFGTFVPVQWVLPLFAIQIGSVRSPTISLVPKDLGREKPRIRNADHPWSTGVEATILLTVAKLEWGQTVPPYRIPTYLGIKQGTDTWVYSVRR